METTVKERHIQFLAVKRISQGAFEKKCGLANGFVSSIRKSVSNEKLQLIAQYYPDLNKAWLLLGEGSMINGEKPVPKKEKEDDCEKTKAEILMNAMNNRMLAPYSLLEDKIKEIEKLNRIIGRLEYILEKYANKSGNEEL